MSAAAPSVDDTRVADPAGAVPIAPPPAPALSPRTLALLLVFVPLLLYTFSGRTRSLALRSGAPPVADIPSQSMPPRPPLGQTAAVDSLLTAAHAASSREGARLVCDIAGARRAAVSGDGKLNFVPTSGDTVTRAFRDTRTSAHADEAIATLLQHPSWHLTGEDSSRAQYTAFDAARAARADTQRPNKRMPPQDGYASLSAIDESPNDARAAAWAWPLAELLPLPSFVSVGVPLASLARAALAGGDADWLQVTESLLRERAAPIHAPLNLTAVGGAHGRDSIIIDTSRARSGSVLAQLVTFSLSQRTLRELRPAEMTLVQTAMERACDELAVAWAASVREAAAAAVGAYREREGCDITAAFIEADADLARERSRETAGSGSDDTRVRGAGRAAAGSVPLDEIIIDVLRSDSAALAGPGRSDAYTDVALPHADMSEGYGLVISESTDASSVPPQVILIADTIWGVVRGLETTVAVLEDWSVADAVDAAEEGAAAIQAAAKAAAAVAGTSVSASCASLSPPQDDTKSETIALPLAIVDAPWRPWRGLLLDTSRHFLPPSAILAALDGLAAAKMNVLHWHVTDAQSFPLDLLSHPTLARSGAWERDAVYSFADVNAIVRAAALRGIRVVPEIDMPAHAASWGKAVPSLVVHCASAGGTSVKELDKFALDPSNEETYKVVAAVLGDVAALFPDASLHIGADEVIPDCWLSEQRLVNFAKDQLGDLYASTRPALGDSGRAYATLLSFFLHRVTSIVEALGKTPIMWEDSFTKLHVAGDLRSLRFDTWQDDVSVALSGAQSSTPTPSVTLSDVDDEGVSESRTPSRTPSRKPPKVPSQSRTPSRTSDLIFDEGESDDANDLVASISPTPSRRVRKSSSPTPSATPPLDAALDDDVLVESSTPTPSRTRKASRTSTRTPSRALSDGSEVEYEDDEEAPTATSTATPTATLKRVRLSQTSTPTPTPTSTRTLRSSPLVRPGESARLSRNVTVQAWKCWESHADKALVDAARAGHATLQSACWYTDSSTPWGDFARHWPLPEHGAAFASLAAMSPNDGALYPASIFESADRVIGGDAAMWTERVDASNLACRVWPRTAATADVGWSESLAYDRFAREYGGKDPTGAEPKSSASARLFSAPRMLAFTRRVLRRGLPAAPLVVFSASTDGGLARVTPPPVAFESDEPAFNGMCPGVEQAIQRPRVRAESLLDAAAGKGGPPRALRFASWNVHDGAAGERGKHVLAWLRRTDADVVAIVEANGWDVSAPAGRRAASAARLSVSAAGESARDPSSDFFVAEDAWNSSSVERSLSTAPTVPHTSAARFFAQTAGFRRRAAAAGYPYSHLATSASGYHVALLSALPVTPVLEAGGVRESSFSRAVLVADAGGVRWIVVHLHAGDSRVRLEEAHRLASLVRTYSSARLPVVVLGDFNSLSSADASCHTEELVVPTLVSPSSPRRSDALAQKYFCRSSEAGCASQAVAVGTDGFLVDYRPVDTIRLASGKASPLTELLSPERTRGVDPHPCPASYPTAVVAANAGVLVDGHDDNSHVPLRLDFAFANDAFLARFPSAACSLGQLHFFRNGSAADAFGGDNSVAQTLREMVAASDHLPLLCMTESR